LQDFQKSHQIIDKILEIGSLTHELRALYLDSKGEFFHLENLIEKALVFYKKSLEIEPEKRFEFRQETIEKQKLCIRIKLEENKLRIITRYLELSNNRKILLFIHKKSVGRFTTLNPKIE
jgi:tetratricopeptide (TPR) repeat protein